MRYLSVVFAILLSLVFLRSPGWAAPPIIATNITTQCPGPTITITLDTVTAGFWLQPAGNPNLYVHFNPPSNGIQWGVSTGWVTPGNPGTYTIGPSPPPGWTGPLSGPHSLQMTSSLSPTGGVPSAVYNFNVPSCKQGMTWIHESSNAQTGTITVGCGPAGPNRCDPYHGDRLCSQLLPLLCIYKPTPAFSVPVGVDNSNQNYQWSGGVVATTAPVAGNSLPHKADADSYCKAQFGAGWNVAEFHNGAGWNFQAYGGTVSAPAVPSTRFWVNINDQTDGNCWTQ